MTSEARGLGHPARVQGIDVARGVASLVMIQGHAYHGWVAEEHRDAGYAFTRVLGTLPLPSFLVMAGAAVTMRVIAAAARGERPAVVRRSMAKRGAQVMAFGYASNLVYAWMDGAEGWDTLLRADVLQLIGLSIIATALLAVRGAAVPDIQRFARTMASLALVSGIACPAMHSWLPAPDGVLRHVVALFIDVPGVTRMPFFPLVAWFGAGAWLTHVLVARRDGSSFAEIAGARGRDVLLLALGGLSLAAASTLLTHTLVVRAGLPLSRASIVIWPNILDGIGRGALVFAAGAALSVALPGGLRRVLVRIGQGSIYAYMFHIPFCYGALGSALRGQLDMTRATLWLVPLILTSVLVVYARAALKPARA